VNRQLRCLAALRSGLAAIGGGRQPFRGRKRRRPVNVKPPWLRGFSRVWSAVGRIWSAWTGSVPKPRWDGRGFWPVRSGWHFEGVDWPSRSRVRKRLDEQLKAERLMPIDRRQRELIPRLRQDRESTRPWFRCSIPASDAPRKDTSGPLPVTTGPGAGVIRLPSPTATLGSTPDAISLGGCPRNRGRATRGVSTFYLFLLGPIQNGLFAHCARNKADEKNCSDYSGSFRRT
jgi:hypothetical protein